MVRINSIILSEMKFLALFTAVGPLSVASYSIGESRRALTTPPQPSRRDVLRWCGSSSFVALATLVPGTKGTSLAAPPPTGPTADEDVRMLADGADALSSLLGNWERATVDCTYADVPRDLLETRNKELLLEKASVFALFDKSVSVVSCKTSNRIVRDYIGATGKGPLVGAERRMLRRPVAERVDPDDLDEYYAQAESYSQAMSRAVSLSYAAGTADFDSMNNFDKEKGVTGGNDTNLEQARRAIAEAKVSLDSVLRLLNVGETVDA